MKSDNNASDRRLHERVLATAAAAAASPSSDDHEDDHDDGPMAAFSTNQDGERELDLEVNRFLESEFFTTTHDSSARSSLQLEDPSAFALREDLLFMDISDSIDMPDLDFGDAVGEAFESLRAQDKAVSSPQVAVASTITSTTAEAPRPATSLRVLIPAGVLFAPSPAAYQREPLKTTAVRSSTPTSGRKRVKDELAYLRQQVQEFEYKLERLRRGSDGDDDLSPSLSLSTASLNLTEKRAFDETTPHLSLWERIAKHQKDEKQKSAAENLKLREMLENQLKLARSLSKVLRRRHDLSWLETPQAEQPTKKLDVIEASDDANVFELLSLQVETLYSELDKVLCEAGLTGSEASAVIQGGQAKTDPEGSVFIEVVDCNVLPFGFRTIGAAMWKLMTTSSLNLGNGQYQAIDITEDTVRALVSLSLTLRRVDTVIQMRLVGKRIVEADRVMFVWYAMGGTQGGKDCIQVRESGWIVIKADTSDDQEGDKDKQQPLTTVQSILRMYPELATNAAVPSSVSESPEDCVGVLTDVVLSSFHQNLAIMRQMIENLIISDTIATMGSSFC